MNIQTPQLEAYLIGSLNAAGVFFSHADLVQTLPAYRLVLGNGMHHLPFFLVNDLRILLEKGYDVRFRSEYQTGNDPPFDRKLVARYERECLGRILHSSDIQNAIEIASMSAHPDRVRERLLHQVLKRLASCFPREWVLNPGLLREYTFAESIQPDDYDTTYLEPLVEQFLGTLNAEINLAHWLHAEDLFELTHFETLSTDHLRVGCRQILEVQRHLRGEETSPFQLNLHEDGADTAFLDETHYPTGGLAGLSNRGSFENLLVSELVYLDEGTDEISLFELRFLEGELLFYLRDSGNLRRKRRSIHFILDVADVFESKLPGYRWQYSVLLQGLCLRLLHDLFELFESDALRFHFHYLHLLKASAKKTAFFEGEIGVMQTVLADYVKHGWVTFETVDSLDFAGLIDPQRKSYAVILASAHTLDAWQATTEAIEDQQLPLHLALVGVNTSTTAEDGLSLPRSGLNEKELILLRERILKKLVS